MHRCKAWRPTQYLPSRAMMGKEQLTSVGMANEHCNVIVLQRVCVCVCVTVFTAIHVLACLLTVSLTRERVTCIKPMGLSVPAGMLNKMCLSIKLCSVLKMTWSSVKPSLQAAAAMTVMMTQMRILLSIPVPSLCNVTGSPGRGRAAAQQALVRMLTGKCSAQVAPAVHATKARLSRRSRTVSTTASTRCAVKPAMQPLACIGAAVLFMQSNSNPMLPAIVLCQVCISSKEVCHTAAQHCGTGRHSRFPAM